jgi:hypothetical protein
MNRAFSAGGLALHKSLGRCPRLLMNAAPLALNKCLAATDFRIATNFSASRQAAPICVGLAANRCVESRFQRLFIIQSESWGDAPGWYENRAFSAKKKHGLPIGAVIKNRNATGEIVKTNAPGRDAIVSRVIWLRGMEGATAHTLDRCIYIHGTAEEQRIGYRASFGCIRMRSKDVIVLYNLVHIGTHVRISAKPLQDFLPPEEPSLLARAD